MVGRPECNRALLRAGIAMYKAYKIYVGGRSSGARPAMV